MNRSHEGESCRVEVYWQRGGQTEGHLTAWGTTLARALAQLRGQVQETWDEIERSRVVDSADPPPAPRG